MSRTNFDKLFNSQHINQEKKKLGYRFESRTYLVKANKSSSKLVRGMRIQIHAHEKEKQTKDTNKKHQLSYFNKIPKLERKTKIKDHTCEITPSDTLTALKFSLFCSLRISTLAYPSS